MHLCMHDFESSTEPFNFLCPYSLSYCRVRQTSQTASQHKLVNTCALQSCPFHCTLCDRHYLVLLPHRGERPRAALPLTSVRKIGWRYGRRSPQLWTEWLGRVSECDRTSPCVPLRQASEKTELTMLWERVWPDVAISETPLSDWLEWLDCDSGRWSNTKKSIYFNFFCFRFYLFILQKYIKGDGQTWKAGGTGSRLHWGRREWRPVVRSLCSSHCLLKVDVQLLPVLRNRQNRKTIWKKFKQ